MHCDILCQTSLLYEAMKGKRQNRKCQNKMNLSGKKKIFYFASAGSPGDTSISLKVVILMIVPL